MRVEDALAVADDALWQMASRYATREWWAEDLHSEAVLRAWASLRMQECEPGWVVRRGRFAMIDALRRSRSLNRERLPEGATPSHEEGVCCRELLHLLPPREEYIVFWRFCEAAPATELAQHMGLSEGRIRQLSQRGVARLRQSLKES